MAIRNTAESNWDSGKSDFDNYQDLWDKALKTDAFREKAPAPEDSENEVDLWGAPLNEPQLISESQIDEWKEMLSACNTFRQNGSPLNEAKDSGENIYKDKMFKATETSKKKDKSRENLKKKFKNLANNPNPVYNDTYGADTMDDTRHTRVSDGLAASEDLDKIIEKLLDAYEVQSEILSNKTNMLTGGMNMKKQKEVDKKLNKIEKIIEKLHRNMQGTQATDQETE
jgi:hypothetical protein